MKRIAGISPIVFAAALLAAIAAFSGCVETPPSSSWAADVYRDRLSSLNRSMTTAQVLDAMCAKGPPREAGGSDTYDLVEGYTLTLFFDADRNHPREVVLHTPYDSTRTHWTELSSAEVSLGAPTTHTQR